MEERPSPPANGRGRGARRGANTPAATRPPAPRAAYPSHPRAPRARAQTDRPGGHYLSGDPSSTRPLAATGRCRRAAAHPFSPAQRMRVRRGSVSLHFVFVSRCFRLLVLLSFPAGRRRRPLRRAGREALCRPPPPYFRGGWPAAAPGRSLRRLQPALLSVSSVPAALGQPSPPPCAGAEADSLALSSPSCSRLDIEKPLWVHFALV